MGIPLAIGFDVGSPIPLDSREVVADISARNAIPLGIRYEMMSVGVKDSDGAGTPMNYQLVGGIADINWVEFAGGGAGGTLEWQPATAYKIGAQVIYLDAIYKANTAHTSDIAFDTDSAYWDLLLSSNMNLLEVSANYAANPTNDVLFVTCSVSNITITLFGASACRKPLTIKKMDATVYTVIINRLGSDLIDGETSYVLYGQNDAIKIAGVNTTWGII